MIEMIDIEKKYGKKIVLNRVCFSASKGEVVLILGNNGSGKTTIFKILLNLIKKYNGKYICSFKKIGGLIEEPSFFPSLSGFENLKVLGCRCDENLKRIIETLNMNEYINKRFSSYSLGMKKRLSIAHIFLSDLDLIVLDEPENSLDQIGTDVLIKLIKQAKKCGKTILISTHHFIEIGKICDRVHVLSNGKLSKNLIAELSENKYSIKFMNENDCNNAAKSIGVFDNFDCILKLTSTRAEISEYIKKLSKFNIISVTEDTLTISEIMERGVINEK